MLSPDEVCTPPQPADERRAVLDGMHQIMGPKATVGAGGQHFPGGAIMRYLLSALVQ